MSDSARKILVTGALPYANGSIHLGHLVEYIQADIWVRFQKLIGNKCTYVCASDAHGTPIMLRARKDNISPEELVERYRAEHQQDFADFHIEFDNYYSTHSEENKELVEDIYGKLQTRGLISTKDVEQAYDEEAGMFLPDRFVKGTCPKCKTEDQYGDNCEACGATYDPTELIDPKSAISGTTPTRRNSEHYFFNLGMQAKLLEEFVNGGKVSADVVKKLDEWFDKEQEDRGLRNWDISRDEPYFGFAIPGTDGKKFFYVWLDAPVGYLASFKNLCERRDDLSFDDYFKADSDAELVHFIGKDIVYFHALFWPAVLNGADYRLPSRINVHGFLTVNGQKMSKSRGTFIPARTFLDYLNPETLRYYYATKLSNSVDDIDLNLEDYVARSNTDLVNKLVNIASRCAGFIAKGHDGQLADSLADEALFKQFVDAGDEIAQLYEARQFSKAMRAIMALADEANRYIDEKKPWVLAKEEGKAAEVQQICTQGLNLFRVLITYLKPVLPVIAENTESFFDAGELTWDGRSNALLGHKINKFKPLMTRIENKTIDQLVEASKQSVPEAAKPAGKKADQKSKQNSAPEDNDMITIDDFLKVDLRVVDIVEANHVEGADSLIQVTVSLDGETRNVFAGIKSAYDPATLVGKQAVLVANLKPRKMKFGVSEGMLLAAGPGGEDIFLVTPDAGAKAGMQVR